MNALLKSATLTPMQKLPHILTEWDRKQQGKRGYNPYAIAIYMDRCADVEAAINEDGLTFRAAIVEGFSGPLLDYILKVTGGNPSTRQEQTGGPMVYTRR